MKSKYPIKEITAIKHFERDSPRRIIYDDSKVGLGAVLKQNQEGEWETTLYASPFITEMEKNYAINEIEVLAVVCALKNFRSVVFETGFPTIKP